ncbi:MAG: hypothetical protein ABSB25_00305 [Sedimentisphaerales bacterium]
MRVEGRQLALSEVEGEVFFICSGSVPLLFLQPVVSGVEPYRRTEAEK